MDKKSIIGIAVVAVLFLGFAYFNSQQQKEYLERKSRIRGLCRFGGRSRAAPVADSLASGVTACRQKWRPQGGCGRGARTRQVETLGESLANAREAEPEEFTVENDVIAVRFSTRGGQIKGVTLKDYTPIRSARKTRPENRDDGPRHGAFRAFVLSEERAEERAGQHAGLRVHGPARSRGGGRARAS